jgi:hypothetical protein
VTLVEGSTGFLCTLALARTACPALHSRPRDSKREGQPGSLYVSGRYTRHSTTCHRPLAFCMAMHACTHVRSCTGSPTRFWLSNATWYVTQIPRSAWFSLISNCKINRRCRRGARHGLYVHPTATRVMTIRCTPITASPRLDFPPTRAAS